MTTLAEDFLKKFQCLEGITVADRQKNFFKLLHEIAPLLKDNVEALNIISSRLTPRTYLETLFRVDFLIYFRRTQELLILLKEGNDVLVSKVVKQIWFFKETLADVPAQQLVTELLPCMSFSVRMKVLRKLSRYAKCEKFEEIFDAFVKRYGIYLASQFITGCGSDKIKQILREYPIKLTSMQLIIMYGKDPQLIDFYFTNSKNSIHTQPYKSLIKFIYNNDSAYFDFLKGKYNISIQLGRRTTKKFVVTNKEQVIKNPYNFNYLNMKAVLRKLGKESGQLFINALPPRFENFIDQNWIFRSFPKKYYYSLIKMYEAHHNMKFADCPSLINEELLRLISEPKERAALAKVKVDNGHDEYLKYLLIEESVQLIKEKINFTSHIYERGNLIEYLIETCHINNNTDALFEVMKYFCFRHKNDELSVHLQFINNIEDLFGFKKFTEEMWASLNDLLTIHMLKFDQSQSTYEKIQTMPLAILNVGTSAHQKLSYLEFLFKKNESIDELATEYFSTNKQFPDYGKFDKKFGKYLLLFAINNVAQSTDKEQDINFNSKLISQINKWNRVYEDDQLSFYDFPVLLNSFNYIIRNLKMWAHSEVFNAFRDAIFTTEQNNYRTDYTQIYWKRHTVLLNLTDLLWFLKYDPLTIATYFDIVFNKLTDNDTNRTCFKVWQQIKKFSHLQLDEKSIQLCLTKLNDDKCTDVKPKLIPSLSLLMKPEDYAALADSYKPQNKKLDLRNEQEVRRYRLQCSIAMNFKNTKCHRVLTSLFNYCAGDYFKHAMRSLYSLLYRTPENELPQYLNYLSTKAVSVRKHALYMTCELSTSLEVENMLKQLNKQEDVQSLQKHMFSTTIQYFVKNPTDAFFGLVKLNMFFVNKADDESLRSIIDHLPKIPQRYKSHYIVHAWEHLENTVDAWQKLFNLKYNIVNSMDVEICKEIPLEFGIRIIQQHFMTNNKTKNLSNIQTFIFHFVSCRDEKQHIFDNVFSIVDQCEKQDEVFEFLRTWYRKIMECRSDNLKYMEPYVNYYEKRVSLIENFHDFIKIFFLRLKLDWSIWSAEVFAEKIFTFFEEVISKCGPHLINLFAKEMNSNLTFFTNHSLQKNAIYYSMMKQHTIPIVAVLLLQVVSEPTHSYLSAREAFKEFVQQIQTIEDVGIQILLKCTYKSYLKDTPVSSDMIVD